MHSYEPIKEEVNKLSFNNFKLYTHTYAFTGLSTGKPGTKIVGKDGQQYEIVVDPLTGKKYKK